LRVRILMHTYALACMSLAMAAVVDSTLSFVSMGRLPIPGGWQLCRVQSGRHADCPVRSVRLLLPHLPRVVSA
jgi:hypothetical protein